MSATPDGALIARALTILGLPDSPRLATAVVNGEQTFADLVAPVVTAAAGDHVEVVSALYRACLGREPDAPGLAGHVRAITEAGARRVDVLESILGSVEFAASPLAAALARAASAGPGGAPYARPRHVTSPDRCHFYHVMDLPELGEVGGEWDLRDGIDPYLGGIHVGGRRVLDVGAASGFVTFELERRGAEVVACDLPEDAPWDVVPRADADLAVYAEERRRLLHRLRNSFWLAHRLLGSSARLVERRADQIPAGAGRFDVAVVSSILMHLRDPLAALECVARLTDTTIVVAEPMLASTGDSALLLFRPAREPLLDTWWTFTPAAIGGMLALLGFGEQQVTCHRQRTGAGDLVDYFTIVAARA